MKIYTKKGDTGLTTVYNGKKIYKNNILIDCLGDLDEFNCELGCLISFSINDDKIIFDPNYLDILMDIQRQLFDIGYYLSCDKVNEKTSLILEYIYKEYLNKIEKSIDDMTDNMPVLINFIIPGGNIIQSLSHRCRAICRRFERKLVNLKYNGYNIDDLCISYINRISDFLFTYSRYIGYINDEKDTIKI